LDVVRQESNLPQRTRIVLIQIDEGSVALTPFGSLSRMNPLSVSRRAKSWTAKLRAVFAFERQADVCF
jgi:hypothetical protein